MTSEERKFYQNLGICPVCTKNSLMGDEKTCLECRARDAELHAKRYEDPSRRIRMIECVTLAKRQRKQRRREQGICIECGRREPREGIATCSVCREKANRKKRERYQKATARSEWVADGLCFLCGDECEKGYKVCRKHHQMYIRNAQTDAAVAHRKRMKAEGLIRAI